MAKQRKKTITAKNLLESFIRVADQLKTQDDKIEKRFNVLFAEEEAKAMMIEISSILKEAKKILKEQVEFKKGVRIELDEFTARTNREIKNIRNTVHSTLESNEERLTRQEGNNQACIRLIRELKHEFKQKGFTVSLETVQEIKKSESSNQSGEL